MANQIKQLTHQLRLLGMHSSVERRALEAESNNLHPYEFLALLLEDEIHYRKEQVAKRLTTRARFRHDAELEEWDQSFERGVSKVKLKELASLSFVHNKENLLLMGRTGEGKTHLAIALGRRLCAAGISVAFHSVNMLFEEIAASRAAGKYLAFLATLSKAQVLILDDFGLRAYTHAEATTLMDILEERHKHGVTVVTSQVSHQGWHKLFEDPVIGEALVDRLVNPSQKIIFKGGSYRERLGSQKQPSA